MRKQFTGLLVLAALVTSCTSEPEPKPAARSLCSMEKGSKGEKAVQQAIRSDRFYTTIHRTTEELVQSLGVHLRQMKDESLYTCVYDPRPDRNSKGADVEFAWALPGELEWGKVAREKIARYDVNGVHVESTYWLAQLSVACRLPGDLAEASQRMLFHVELANLSNSERRNDTEARKRQIELLYILAGRAADALGCEGDPLKGDPVVKPLPAA
ncbi:hypothetical protein GCM10010305_11900 [Streptomyces termitum]|uniref:Lipoprotein n=2 Tax=Streptomyces termitum TaxID=67368 RepID=A0A918STL3_9ACTN|nr:hypothetical protein GCM10010305_11900 [Streptomyces termitum]